ncbi:hypothetical protein [Bradyrhizobium sp. 2TAF24]|uniref:hypothetical protein n=1 Tax=Bradyrhizobium sp. 2TAF24 TaxID=3233011 RepID=UPI003F93A755
MTAFGSKMLWHVMTAACVTAGLLAASPSHAQSGPFAGMSGSWSGTGTVQIADGASERIRCRATYTVGSDGNTLQQVLRCASDSYRFDLSSDVTNRSGSLTGTWSEASRGINGGVEGRASDGQFNALVTANGFAAELRVTARGNRQTIAINSQNTQFRGVQITLAR